MTCCTGCPHTLQPVAHSEPILSWLETIWQQCAAHAGPIRVASLNSGPCNSVFAWCLVNCLCAATQAMSFVVTKSVCDHAKHRLASCSADAPCSQQCMPLQRRSSSISHSDLQLLRWHLIQANLNHHTMKGMSPAMSQAASFSRGSRGIGSLSRTGVAHIDGRIASITQRMNSARFQVIQEGRQDPADAAAIPLGAHQSRVWGRRSFTQVHCLSPSCLLGILVPETERARAFVWHLCHAYIAPELLHGT